MTPREATTFAGDTAVIEADVREGTYGDKIATIEAGGAEYIPLSERHGKPLQQFWTWVSPNMEFATIFVGIIGVWFFGQSFWLAALAIVLGAALGSLSMGVLAARGPLFGVPQMVQSRIGFGRLGNILPAGINALVAGVEWFAVNSVSGAFAVNALLRWNTKLCLLLIVLVQLAVAFFGHNLVHALERWAFKVLAVVFLIASVVAPGRAHCAVLRRVARRLADHFRRRLRICRGLEPLRQRLHAVPAQDHQPHRDWAVGRPRGVHLLRLARARGCRGRHRNRFVALSGLSDAGTKYNNFLLVIAYWIGPWLGVFFADQFLRRGKPVDGLLFDRNHNPWAGVAAMAISIGLSIWLFANQTDYLGDVPDHHPAFGDLTFEVGLCWRRCLTRCSPSCRAQARLGSG